MDGIVTKSINSYNIGIRECTRCGTKIHLMFPEEGDRGSQEYTWNRDRYLDNLVKSFGWESDRVRGYCCVACQKEESCN